MEIRSISRVFDQYLGRIREIVYTKKVDQNNKQIIEQVTYYRQPDPTKGSNVDVKV